MWWKQKSITNIIESSFSFRISKSECTTMSETKKRGEIQSDDDDDGRFVWVWMSPKGRATCNDSSTICAMLTWLRQAVSPSCVFGGAPASLHSNIRRNASAIAPSIPPRRRKGRWPDAHQSRRKLCLCGNEREPSHGRDLHLTRGKRQKRWYHHYLITHRYYYAISGGIAIHRNCGVSGYEMWWEEMFPSKIDVATTCDLTFF